VQTYITIENLNKAYGTQVLFEEAFLTIHENQKIGLIGRNGAGKSTLMRIITGEESPDSGEVMIHPGVSLGYLISSV
jgi:ATPase subunit of ABC transporter with duplicated ATPase domains